MKKLKTVSALVLVLTMLCSCSLIPPKEIKETPSPSKPAETPASTLSPTVKDYFADAVHEDFDYSSIVYTHYDDTEFTKAVDRITELAGKAGSFDEISSQYTYCYNEMVVMLTMNTEIYLQYYSNVNDESLGDEAVWSDNLVNEDFDYLCTALEQVMESSYADQFASLVGADAADFFSSYIAATDRETELLDQESELEVLYEQQAAAEYTTEMYGKTWTAASLDAAASTLSSNQYYAIRDAIDAQFYATLGDTYMKLLTVRSELAGIYGYDSYADYAYDKIYGRDYTTDDIKAFREAVKDYVAPTFFSNIIVDDAFYTDLGVNYSTDDLLEILGTYLPDISGEMMESYNYMMRNHLYNIGSDDSMTEGGFTTELYQYNAPFIYYKTYGDVSDVSGIIHEFGHYNDSYFNSYGNVLSDSGAYDIFEIHSTGLEVLFYNYYDDIFGDAACQAKIVNGGYLLAGIVYGCIYDEFQEFVYDNPNMSLQEINNAYYYIASSYGYPYPSEMPQGDGSWMYIPHNFTEPMYYISYATSTLCSVAIWDTAQTDREAAIDDYLTLVSYGSYNYGYQELMEKCGFGSITDSGYVQTVCTAFMNYLRDQIDLENSGASAA